MARRGAILEREKDREEDKIPGRRSRASAGKETAQLDGLVHERVRLGILCALAVNTSLSFNDLKALLDTTAGNLSVHARRLEEAGYVTCAKSFRGRLPRTDFTLTGAGRKALQGYMDHMEALIHAMKDR